MKIFISILLVHFAIIATAQTPSSEDNQNTRDTVGAASKVQIESAFPGGSVAWRDYLTKNFKVDQVSKLVLMDVPDSVKKKELNLQFTAIVQFIVCKDGTVCEVRTLNEVPAAFKTEAERLISESKIWVPAEQDGKKVKAYRKQPITLYIPID